MSGEILVREKAILIIQKIYPTVLKAGGVSIRLDSSDGR